MATLFISQDYLIEKSVIDSNVDFKKITPAIIEAQELDLLPLLGTDLYDAMEAHIIALVDNSTAIPAAYKTLLDDYIIKALMYYVLGRISPTFKFKYAAKGIMVKNSDNSQQADTIDMEKMEDRWRNIAMQYANRMTDFLIFNYGTYPEYAQISSSTFKIYPKRNAIDIPIYLEERNDE